MIIDVQHFIDSEKPYWQELSEILDRLSREPMAQMALPELRRFHYLYERTSADLGRIATFAGERQTRRYLESLVARAYGEIHETRRKPQRFRPLHWATTTFPQTFRRHIRAFHVAWAATLVGCIFGALALAFDTSAKATLVPFRHLMGTPSERVAQEEQQERDALAGRKAEGAARYMTHNTRVSLSVMATGATWGVGTLILLFYNGVILGAVAIDYILDGHTVFLLGWLLPHGSVEIPAILIAGQAGFVIAGALIGWGRSVPLRQRLREVSGSVGTLVLGVALLLVWAGIIEAFLSQYHEPVIPYEAKVVFGAAQLLALIVFLRRAGKKGRKRGAQP